MLYSVERRDVSLTLSTSDSGIDFFGGALGDFKILPSPIFDVVLENSDGEEFSVSSSSGWKSLRHIIKNELIKLWFSDSENFGDLTVVVTGKPDEKGFSWQVDVINESTDFSVIRVSYPMPRIAASPLHLFEPNGAGRVFMNTEINKYSFRHPYPHPYAAMQYMAVWSERRGVYFGIHDPRASMKNLSADAEGGEALMRAEFQAIGAGNMQNSFSLGGCARWEIFDGDWYDAALIYRDFVRDHAEWLPVKGRPDTPDRFKDVGFWIADYIPNSESQRDARPMVLAAISEKFGNDYWFEAPLQLRRELGVPIAYHVYNWHEIPFNINYPHFLPAREKFLDGMKKLKDGGVYVLPYINSVSWEKNDADEGFAENFDNTGIRGAALKKDGTTYDVIYPQRKANGKETVLVPMCPTFPRWHTLIGDVARTLEQEYGVDGVYFDEIAAHEPYPCRNKSHAHLPGGGSYWSESYNLMFERIAAKKNPDSFYFTEDNGEPYMKAFDGYLTWIWRFDNNVPAYPLIYAGYIQMVGRYTDGKNRDDDLLYRYHLAESLLFGQQLGWLNAHVVYNEDRLAFLKKIVGTRYENRMLFNAGHLLRPPKIETSLAPLVSSDSNMRQVLSGVWQLDDGSRTVLFCVNISKERAMAKLTLYPKEYGVSCSEELNLELEPLSVKAIEL